MPKVFGNTEGLKQSQARLLQSLYNRRIPTDRFIHPELARTICEVSRNLKRQVGLMADRKGKITHVIIGDAHRLFIPDLTRHRAGSSRFRGLRLLHTHLRKEPLSRDDLTDLTLLRLDAIVVIQALPTGLPGPAQVGYLNPDASLAKSSKQQTKASDEPWLIDDIPSVYDWITHFTHFITDLEERFSKRDATRKIKDGIGAILIGVTSGSAWTAQAQLRELERLGETSGLQVRDRFFQHRRKPDHRFVVGKGKLQDILIRAMQLDCEVLVFDQELSPSQLRNIATATDLNVVDRTQLILDIFAQRAQSREGKLQVEIAQLRYRKPRLKLMPTAMSRLTGGIGGRGPGETKLEINRRRADERLNRLEKQLKSLSKGRKLRRSRRKKAGIPQVALVGYTNAGKSTLLNKMTQSKVDAEDKLFATLDPTSRRLRFPRERELILTDTVGFIRNLPKELMEAFRSTFEETLESDLILHVADASDPELSLHLSEVRKTLQILQADTIPQLLVLNKIDMLDPTEWSELAQTHQALLCSAHQSIGLTELMETLEQQLFSIKAGEQR